jgi:arylsulfatase A-like enzyme
MNIRRPGTVVAALLAALLPLSCGGAKNRPANLVLVTVDTLRPDHLGYAGYARPTSPNIDRLAESSVVFTRAYSQAGWTLPSMATILTGRHPKDHKATDLHFRLDASLPTLASILRERGYDTRGYVSHVLLTSKYGLDKGFVRFDSSVLDRGDPHTISTSRELTDLAIGDLDDLREPFFVWIHYFDPHFDYLPHAPWTSFGDGAADRYDQEIAFTDAEIARVLAFLERGGKGERTFVVFTADHGEEFGDHGGIFHETCFEEVVRVPLAIRGPGLAPSTRDDPVDQVDLLPTLLGLVGATLPMPLPGRDLFSDSFPSKPIFIERDRPSAFRQRAVVLSSDKLVRVERRDTTLVPPESRIQDTDAGNVVPGAFLYGLAADRSERVERSAADPALAERMLALLAGHFVGPGGTAADTVVVDAEMRERLRALGYLR